MAQMPYKVTARNADGEEIVFVRLDKVLEAITGTFEWRKHINGTTWDDKVIVACELSLKDAVEYLKGGDKG